MIDTERKVQFIRDGLVRYPQARETVDDFEKFIDEALVAAFEEKATWLYFQPSRPSGDFEFGKHTGTVDRYVARWIAGTIPSKPSQAKCFVNLGIYWHPPLKTDLAVIAVSHVTTDRGRAVPMRDRPDRDPRVVMSPLFKRSERRLFVNLDAAELATALPLLLDAVDDAVSPDSQGA